VKPPATIRVDDDLVTIEDNATGLGVTIEGYPYSADYKRDRIRLARNTRRSAKRENLAHEVLHKIWEKAGLSERYATKTEEYIITSLAGLLTDVLRDNPALVEFLTEQD
jgi:hypothetical protein